MNSSLPSIQNEKHQCEQKAQKNRSAQRKIKRKVVSLIMEIKRKTAKPERQFRTDHQQQTQQREDAAHYQEHSAKLLHIVILRQSRLATRIGTDSFAFCPCQSGYFV